MSLEHFFHISIILIHLTLGHGYEYKATHRVSLDIAIDDKEEGSIIIAIFGELTPKTAKNFLTLSSTGVNGKSYARTPFHRVVKKFMIQGGDVVYQNGSGSLSIYGDSFPDENFEAKHWGPGFVSMANYGPDSNGCQFFITTTATPWLDGKHVVFGKVIKGQNLVHKIEMIPTDGKDRPKKEAMIIRTRVLDTKQDFTVSDKSENLWELLRATCVPLSFSLAILIFFHWIYRKLDSAEKNSYKIE